MSKTVIIQPAGRLEGTPFIPGDKSISHRSLMFGAIARGRTRVANLLESGDVRSTWSCLEAMGAEIRDTRAQDGFVWVEGKGLFGLKAPNRELDCGNSGTTIRLLMGLLCGQGFDVRMTGDASLRKRPMKRVAEPLRAMGARIELDGGNLAPVLLQSSGEGAGLRLRACDFALPVASAQLKSAVLLAGLYAEGTTRLSGLIQSRDHTERLLPHFGAQIEKTATELRITGGQQLRGCELQVPGDISTAAFWLAAAARVPGSRIIMHDVSLNPTRTGILKVLERMGARIRVELTVEQPEPMGTLTIESTRLVGTEILAAEVPELIDELPMIAVLACGAEGTTVVHGAEELRVKESDRIEAVARNLRAMGGVIETFADGFAVKGPQKLRGARIDTFEDHRIAMAFSIAGLQAEGSTEIVGADCVGISYPAFFSTLEELRG